MGGCKARGWKGKTVEMEKTPGRKMRWMDSGGKQWCKQKKWKKSKKMKYQV